MAEKAMDVWAVGPVGYGAYSLEWSEDGPSLTPTQATPSHILTPGVIDVHVHGGFGIDAMTADTNELIRLADRFEEIGYEGFLPTTVTASVDVIQGFLARLPEHPAILGFHLEGPFISPLHPGAQPPQAIAKPPVGESEWTPVLEDPRLKVITIAPELDGALSLIAQLTSAGVRCGMGHTDATFEQAKLGFNAGASHTIHTFNAMRGFHHREAGIAGYALTENDLYCELIYDRKHVVFEAAQILVKNKPNQKLLGISDGTMAAGMAAGTHIRMWGLSCIVGDHEVRLENGTLAGSGIHLMDAFRNLCDDFGYETAIRACALNPRNFLGLTEPPKTYLLLNSQLEVVDRWKAPQP